MGLRDTLWALLFPSTASSSVLSRPIQTQLSLALAALIAQCNEGLWPDPLAQAISELDHHRPLVLGLLGHIPEQLANRLLPAPRDFLESQRSRLVDGQFERVLTLLGAQLTGIDQRQVLVALHSWVRYAGETHAVLASPLLLRTAFAFVQQALEQDSQEDLDESVELVCELYFRVHQLDEIESEDWLAVLFAGLASVQPAIQEALADPDRDESDEELLRRLCMLYSEAGEAFILHFMGRPRELENLLAVLLAVVTGTKSSETLEATFPFWEVLSQRVSELGEDAAMPFRPVFSSLLHTAIDRHLVYPAEGAGVTAEQLDRFRDFRHVVGDVLKDCVRAMGSTEALTVIAGLFTQRQSGDWRPLEAVLFGLRTIGSTVDRRESEVLPGLYASLLSVQGNNKLRNAVLLNIGVYADWLRYHPEHLPATLDYVAAGFNEATTAPASAQTLRYLCESCSRQLASFLPALMALYGEAAVKGGATSRRDRVELSAALGYLLSAQPPSESLGHWQACLEPWRLALTTINAVEACEHLRALFSARLEDPYLGSANELIEFFATHIWPSFETINLSAFSSQEDWDSLVGCLRSCILAFANALPPTWDPSLFALFQHLLSCGQLSALYALRCYLFEASDTRRALAWPHLQPLLAGVTDGLLAATGPVPDLADYFSACSALVDCFAIPDALLKPVLSLAQRTLGTRPPVPSDIGAALSLLAHLLQQSLSEGTPVTPPIAASLTACTQTLLAASLTLYPPDLIADLPPVLTRLHRLSPGMPTSCLRDALTTVLPAGSIVERELATWLQQFETAMASSKANREVKEFMRQLAQACQRRIH